jgi:protein gp37
MESSKIAWTHNTFNPWWGCEKVSPGCKFCYAEKLDARYNAGNEHWGPGAPRKLMSEHYWNDPLRWEKKAKASGSRTRVFCASMADVFDEEAPEGQRDRLFDVIRKTPSLDWLLLTKRPQNAKHMLPSDWGSGYPNVWVGASMEDQKRADERMPVLADIPAVVRFASVEPQLEFIDFRDLPMDWLIFGGESESQENARPFDPEWVRPYIHPARDKGVAIFVKQMGTKWAAANGATGKAEDPAEWPFWLRVREFPTARAA